MLLFLYIQYYKLHAKYFMIFSTIPPFLEIFLEITYVIKKKISLSFKFSYPLSNYFSINFIKLNIIS